MIFSATSPGEPTVSGPAGERQGNVVARVAVERAGEVGGLAAAAKNEKLRRFHAADEVAL